MIDMRGREEQANFCENLKQVCFQIRGVCSDDGTGDMMRWGPFPNPPAPPKAWVQWWWTFFNSCIKDIVPAAKSEVTGILEYLDRKECDDHPVLEWL